MDVRLVLYYGCPVSTKSKKHRSLPLTNPKLQRILQDWIDFRQKNEGTLFNEKSALFKTQKGLAFSANTLTRMINNLYKNNGFYGCSSHTGRRSAITKLANRGIALHKIKILVGHKSVQTTLGYIDENPDEMGEIMKAL